MNNGDVIDDCDLLKTCGPPGTLLCLVMWHHISLTEITEIPKV